jgi:ribonuclease BN (tRNA processing enzyme)
VELTVLGSDGAFPRAGGACSGYLLRHEGFNLVLDLGPGAFSQLQRHVPHDDVDAIVVSHEHPDHCLDLYPLYTARRFHLEPLPPLPLFAPSGVFERVAALEDGPERDEMGRSFDVREIEPGDGFEIGPYRVSTRLLPHWVPNAGLRISVGDRVLAYTGDTGPSSEIEVIGRDADLVVSEASWQGSREDPPPFHLTARQAGEHARRAGAARLLLTHFWPTLHRDTSGAEAREAFSGEVLLAEEGAVLPVGP